MNLKFLHLQQQILLSFIPLGPNSDPQVTSHQLASQNQALTLCLTCASKSFLKTEI